MPRHNDGATGRPVASSCNASQWTHFLIFIKFLFQQLRACWSHVNACNIVYAIRSFLFVIRIDKQTDKQTNRCCYHCERDRALSQSIWSMENSAKLPSTVAATQSISAAFSRGWYHSHPPRPSTSSSRSTSYSTPCDRFQVSTRPGPAAVHATTLWRLYHCSVPAWHPCHHHHYHYHCHHMFSYVCSCVLMFFCLLSCQLW